MQVPRGIQLGAHDVVDLRGAERLDDAVGQHTGGVDHRGERAVERVEQVGELVAVGHVAGGDAGLGAECGEFGDQFGGAVGGRAAPADQQQVAGTAPGDEVPGEQGAQAAGAPGDEHGPLGVEGCGHGQHDLADVAALAQVAERLLSAAYVPGADRRGGQHSAGEQFGDLDQHLLDAVGSRLHQVVRAVAHAGAPVGDGLGVADVGLAHLDEAAAPGQQFQ